MPDEPIPAPAPEPRRRNMGLLNQAQVRALSRAEQIALAAQKPAYASALGARDITPGVVDDLLNSIDSARKMSAQALQSTTSKETATGDETSASKALVIALQEIQAAAKQKYARTSPVTLQDYYIGKRLAENRASLEQYAEGILLKLQGDAAATPPIPADPLPGITPAKIASLAQLSEAYTGTETTQSGEQSDATDERAERDNLIDEVTDQRITIQFAADAEWPYTDDNNAGVRREFGLPLSRPFNG